MTDEPIRLIPKAEQRQEKLNETVLRLYRKCLDEAEKEPVEAAVVLRLKSGIWSASFSAGLSAGAIGCLDIVKSVWIADYLKSTKESEL